MLSLATHTTNPHFARLFAAAEKPCAIQLWVLIAGSQPEKIVKRVIYGRVVPYSFDSDSWIFSKNDKTQTIEGERVKLARLNLFVSSQNTKAFFEHFCSGQTLDEVSQQLNLSVDEFFNKTFGDVALNPTELIFQPAEYLLNKSAYEHNALHSPHESAGAISAAIAQSNKLYLFSEISNQNNSLLTYAAEKLKEDTGLDFLGSDKERLGNIELLVFPSLDDKERAKLIIEHQREKQAIKIELAAEEQSNVDYQFLIKLFNLEKLIYSTLQTASYCEAKQTYATDFQLDTITNEIYDRIEVETYLNKEGKSFELQDRWHMSYVREISFNMHLIGAEQQPIKLNWLEKKKVSPKYSARAQAVLTPNKSTPETTTIGGRDKETWVALNRELSEKFKLLKPQASKGKFFLRYGLSQGEGAIEFLEWFKKLFSQYQNHHIAIFDPYFEALGLSLLKLYGARQGNYSVFTSYPNEKDDNDKEQRRFNTLLELCDQNQKSLRELNLTIYGLKQGELHDRYVLVLNNESIPVQGFHLSNSLQSATVNHPLLVTPIPQDVLLEVSYYMQEIIQKSNSKETTNVGTKILFNSQDSTAESEAIHQENKPKENDPLSNLLPKEIVEWINTGAEQNSFETDWLKVATSLANTSTDSFLLLKDLPSSFLDQLEGFLIQATQQTETEHEEISTIAPSFYTTQLDELLNLDIELALRHSYSKARNLNWAEFYAIKLLWQHRPKVLFDLITTAGKKNLTKDFKIDASNAKLYTLLDQALSTMQLSVVLDPTDKQAQQLLNNDNAVLQWFGLNMLSQLVVKTNNPNIFFTAIQNLSKDKQITSIGWLVLQLRAEENQSILQAAITKLYELLPNTLDEQEVKHLLNAMRGRLKNLSHNGTWINEKILQPLLEQERININDLAEIWFSDLKQELPLFDSSGSVTFSNKYEGSLTNLTAYFYAYSSAALQEKIANEIVALHKKIQRLVQKPLARTTNYKKWSGALFTALWLEAFINLALHYQEQAIAKISQELKELKNELNQITQRRSQTEWQQYQSELVDFYYQTN